TRGGVSARGVLRSKHFGRPKGGGKSGALDRWYWEIRPGCAASRQGWRGQRLVSVSDRRRPAITRLLGADPVPPCSLSSELRQCALKRVLLAPSVIGCAQRDSLPGPLRANRASGGRWSNGACRCCAVRRSGRQRAYTP